MAETPKLILLKIRGVLSGAPCALTVQTIAEVAGLNVNVVDKAIQSLHAQALVHRDGDGRYTAGKDYRVEIPAGAESDLLAYLRDHGPVTRPALGRVFAWADRNAGRREQVIFYAVTLWLCHRGDLWVVVQQKKGTLLGLPSHIVAKPEPPTPKPRREFVEPETVSMKSARQRIRAVLSALEKPVGIAAVARLAELDMKTAQAALEAGAKDGKYRREGGAFWRVESFWEVPGLFKAREDLLTYLRENGPKQRPDMVDALPWTETKKCLLHWLIWYGVIRTLEDERRIWVKRALGEPPLVGLIGQEVPRKALPMLKTKRADEPLMRVRRPAAPIGPVTQCAVNNTLLAPGTPGSPDPIYG